MLKRFSLVRTVFYWHDNTIMNSAFVFFLLMIPGTILAGIIDILYKKVLVRGFNKFALPAYVWGFSGILFLPFLFMRGVPSLAPDFWLAFSITLVLNVFLQYLLMTALQKADASLVAPVSLMTTPLVIVTGYFILGEMPTLLGIAGILISFLGLWLLITPGTVWGNFFDVSLLQNPGVLAAFLGSIIASVSSVYDKKAVLASSTLFFSTLILLGVGLASGIIAYAKSPEDRRALMPKINSSWLIVLFLIILTAVAFFLFTDALRFAFASYAISVRRLRALWAVLLAGAFLQERKFLLKRFIATLVMLAGVFLIAFAG